MGYSKTTSKQQTQKNGINAVLFLLEVVLKMSVKWTTKTNKLPEIAKTINTLNGKGVKVGALTGNHAWL